MRVMTDFAWQPLWLRNASVALPTVSQFVLHGSIRDVVPGFDEQGRYVGSMGVKDAIWRMLEGSGFDAMIEYSAPDKLAVYVPSGDASGARFTKDDVMRCINDSSTYDLFDGRTTDFDVDNAIWYNGLDQLVPMLDTTSIEADPDDLPFMNLALLIDYTSQAVNNPSAQQELDKLMLACLKHVNNSPDFIHKGFTSISIKHPVFWLVDQPNDLPGWMLSGDGIRQIPIGRPDFDERMRFARAVLASSPKLADDLDSMVAQFASVTDGISNRGILEIYKLVIAGDVQRERIIEAARQYRLGITENPWQKPELKKNIKDAERLLAEAVYGQDKAIRRAVDLLMQASLNMTHAHTREGGTGPRGVMFFAGATGVGKTELAKSIARLVFGSADRIVRFDMSEFTQEHTESRLVGSPPGYIGHGVGGELTNAIRQQPHSVVLFDEIEKAHDKILDKFLQILSDGRLTDGSGDTVFFSETIIVFTSNQGADAAQRILDEAAELGIDLSSGTEQAEAMAALYESAIRSSVVRYFTEELARPELLGRIGEQNIVVFQPITPGIAARIASNCISNIKDNLLKQNGCTVVLDAPAEQQCIELATADLTKGGRGVIDAMRDILLAPLARALFGDEGIESITISAIDRDESGGYHLVVRDG